MLAKLLFLLRIIFLVCLPLSSLALSTDKDKPINIEADKLDIDDTQHISTYQGNVKLSQGSMHIHADKIIFFFNATDELDYLKITGSPASIDQQNDQGKSLNGSAKTIFHYQNDSILKFIGNAIVTSSKDSIKSETITINTKTDVIHAGAMNKKEGDTVSNNERVKMIIQPKNKNAKK